MDITEEVDFDFFETPRNDNYSKRDSKEISEKKPPANFQKKHGDLSNGKHSDNDKLEPQGNVRDSSKQKSKYDYSDDTFSSSESESDTPRHERTASQKAEKGQSEKKSEKVDNAYSTSTESSSAYSNSDYTSDDNDQYEKYSRKEKKETIDVHIPKAHVEAWGDKASNKSDRGREKFIDRNERLGRRKKPPSELSDSESDNENNKRDSRNSHKGRNDRAKSAKDRNRMDNGKRKTLRSSSSYSNNSDITDVSPLESPEGSPRPSGNRNNSRVEGNKNGKFKNVQYSDSSSPERDNHSINLESEQIDLSILMKCMADIDREKQERLKTNSRRVMFAPPTVGEKSKANYTFTMSRAKMIEKENQRLLKQIMMQMNSGTAKKAPSSAPRPKGPKKAVEPVVQRLTPSAVNRMREQRRIEAENMHILQRLQSVKPTRGMGRSEQISEAERQMSYGIPSGTVIVQGQRSHYDTMSQRSLQSSLSHTAGSTQRSRPSSAKSNTSTVVTPGKRSRPSSAKSNASIRSNASMRSNVSKRSNVSVRSGILAPGVRRMADGRIDNRPLWDDRFSFS